MHDLLAGQMIGQRLALRLVGARGSRSRRVRCFGAGGIFGRTGFQFLELQLQLGDLAGDSLRRATELHAAQLRDLETQLLDLQRLQLYCSLRRLQLALAGERERVQCGGIIGQFGRGERHASTYPHSHWATRIEKESVLCQTNTGCGAGGGASVRRQSIASISTENCAGVSVIAPSTIGGQTKRPFSRAAVVRLSSTSLVTPSPSRPGDNEGNPGDRVKQQTCEQSTDLRNT